MISPRTESRYKWVQYEDTKQKCQDMQEDENDPLETFFKNRFTDHIYNSYSVKSKRPVEKNSISFSANATLGTVCLQLN